MKVIELKTGNIDFSCTNLEELVNNVVVLYRKNCVFKNSIDSLICDFNSTREGNLLFKDIIKIYNYKQRILDGKKVSVKKTLLVKEFFEVMLEDYRISVFLNNFGLRDKTQNQEEKSNKKILKILNSNVIEEDKKIIVINLIENFIFKFKSNIDDILKTLEYDYDDLEEFLYTRISLIPNDSHRYLLMNILLNSGKILGKEVDISTKPVKILVEIFCKNCLQGQKIENTVIFNDILKAFYQKEGLSDDLKKILIKIIYSHRSKISSFSRILSFLNIKFKDVEREKDYIAGTPSFSNNFETQVADKKVDGNLLSQKLLKAMDMFQIKEEDFKLDDFIKFLLNKSNFEISKTDTNDIRVKSGNLELQRSTTTNTKVKFSVDHINSTIENLTITELGELLLIYIAQDKLESLK